MLNVSNVSLQYGSRVLFKEVNLSFKRGNCYGVIGANGAGKSTFLKILSGELEPNTGEVTKDPGERIAVLKQDHFAYENNTVLETVMMGFPELYELSKKRDELYALPEMTEEQGMQAMEIETRFGEIGGYEADSNAAVLLKGLGIPEEFHYNLMSELDGGQKIRCSSPRLCLATRTFCSWTNRRTTLIWKPSAGSKTTSNASKTS